MNNSGAIRRRRHSNRALATVLALSLAPTFSQVQGASTASMLPGNPGAIEEEVTKTPHDGIQRSHKEHLGVKKQKYLNHKVTRMKRARGSR